MARGIGGFFIVRDSMTRLLATEAAAVVPRTKEILEEKSDEVLTYAKVNAPWADITGNARSGLDVEVYSHGTTIVLELFHTVDYGIWLETIQNGAYATILPTLEHFAQELMRAVGAHETGEDLG